MSKKKKTTYNVEGRKVNMKFYFALLIIFGGLTVYMPVIIKRVDPNMFEFNTFQIRTIGGLILFMVWLINLAKSIDRAGHKYMKGREMGTSRFMDAEDYTATLMDKKHPENNMRFSMDGQRKIAFKGKTPNNNTLVIGGSGGGKTAGYIATNLLQNADMSNVITDPKGDTARDFGVALEKMGRKVGKIDLTEMSTSLQYNPFKYLDNADEVGQLVDNIIDNTTDPKASSSDPFWDKAEAMFDKFLCYYTWMECPQPYYKYTTYRINQDSEKIDVEEELSLVADELMSDPKFVQGRGPSARLCQIFRTPVKDGNGNIMTLDQTFRTVLTLLSEAEIKESGASDLDCRMAMLMQKVKERGEMPENNRAIDNYNKTVRAAADTARSIIVSANARFDAFKNEALLRIFDDDEVDLFGLCKGTERRDLFLIIPDDTETYNFVVGMLYTQLFQTMYRVARRNFGKLPKPVGVYMDEFANIKMPNNFKKILSTIRSRRSFIVIIVQALAQLKTLYPQDEWEEIVGNCDNLLYLGGNEPGSHKFMSELLGKMTIDKQSQGQTLGRQGNSSTNDDVVGRELMTDAEIAMLPSDECLFRTRGYYTVRDKKCFWFMMPEYDYIKKFNKWDQDIQIRRVGERLVTVKPGSGSSPIEWLGDEDLRLIPAERYQPLSVYDFLFIEDEVESTLQSGGESNNLQINSLMMSLNPRESAAKTKADHHEIALKLKALKKAKNELDIQHIIYSMPFNDEQFAVLLQAKDAGLTSSEIATFANPEMGVLQMKMLLKTYLEQNETEAR